MTEDVKVEIDNKVECEDVAIIGTAGRDEHQPMSKDMFLKMVDAARQQIEEKWQLKPSQVRLVSGGAAWSDHIAVELFLKHEYAQLELNLPCRWQEKSDDGLGPCYVDNGQYSWKTNPGHMSNHYHQECSKSLGYSTLQEIQDAMDKGAMTHVYAGFHARNRKIARAKYMVAFSWASEPSCLSGGTKYTWNASRALHRHHVSLAYLA